MKLTHKSYFNSRDKFKIYYECNFDPSKLINQDTVLVFNYGLVCNFEHFKFQIKYFKERNYKILIHDYRFHFKSSSTNNLRECSFQGITNDLNQLLVSIGDPNIILIGHSMGVNINLEYCYRFAEKVLGQVLISGTYIPPQKVMFNSSIIDHIQPILENAAKQNPGLNKLIWSTNHNNKIARKVIHLLGFHYQNVSDQFIKFYLKKIGELEPMLFFQLLTEMKEQNLKKELKMIKTPSLIMAGDKDYIIPLKHQKDLADKLNNSKFYIIKDGSHVPQIDFPESVSETIHYYIENYFSKPSV